MGKGANATLAFVPLSIDAAWPAIEPECPRHSVLR